MRLFTLFLLATLVATSASAASDRKLFVVLLSCFCLLLPTVTSATLIDLGTGVIYDDDTDLYWL